MIVVSVALLLVIILRFKLKYDYVKWGYKSSTDRGLALYFRRALIFSLL
jgi:hypothetical protein